MLKDIVDKFFLNKEKEMAEDKINSSISDGEVEVKLYKDGKLVEQKKGEK
ncbi:hypothetical protein FACS1894109_20930 [Spirochaetia bacterium]|nr:hypothetical protein FACS1894109_20930 [Spirochaetia bacterium]